MEFRQVDGLDRVQFDFRLLLNLGFLWVNPKIVGFGVILGTLLSFESFSDFRVVCL